MRILCVSAQKPDSTGSGVYLTETVKGMLAAGHEVAVVAGIDREDEPSLPANVLFRPVRFRTPELPFSVCGMSDEMPYAATRYRDMTPEMVCQFKRAFTAAFDEVLPAFRPDLTVSHHLYLVTALLAHRDLPCPLAAVSHSTDLRQMRSHGLERDYILEGIRRVDAVCALHAAQAREIRELYGVPEERIVVVGTGYNDAVFRPAGEGAERERAVRVGEKAKAESPGADAAKQDASPAGAAESGPEHANALGVEDAGTTASRKSLELAYAGKIWHKKGVDCLLRSLELLPRPEGGLRLRLAGGFAHQDEYDRMRALAAGVAGRTGFAIDFLGKLPQEELARVYQSADVFVLPSFFEGLPLVVVEALACGCRVVVTDLPGVREWLDAEMPGAPVVYVPCPPMATVDEPEPDALPQFEEDLARAIERAAAMPAVALPEAVLKNLSWENVARRIVTAGTDAGR